MGGGCSSRRRPGGPTCRLSPVRSPRRWKSAARLLAEQRIIVLDLDDPATQQIQLYWTIFGTDQLAAEPRYVPRTDLVVPSALRELLWGPPPASNIGYATALPTPEQILNFPRSRI